MAKDSYYAWSTIIHGDDKGNLTTMAPGDTVTMEDLGTDEEGFNAYLLSGAVRPYPYPDMPATAASQSPIEFMREKVLKDAQDEEAQLTAALDPELARASVGPVPLSEPVVLEGAEEATGPTKDASKK